MLGHSSLVHVLPISTYWQVCFKSFTVELSKFSNFLIATAWLEAAGTDAMEWLLSYSGAPEDISGMFIFDVPMWNISGEKAASMFLAASFRLTGVCCMKAGRMMDNHLGMLCFLFEAEKRHDSCKHCRLYAPCWTCRMAREVRKEAHVRQTNNWKKTKIYDGSWRTIVT